MNEETLKNRLMGSSLCEAEMAYDLLQRGAQLMIGSDVIDVSSSGLLETYRIRGDHISERSGDHAQRLSKSTIEFVNLLESRRPKYLKTARILSPDLGFFLIWYEPLNEELIGCCYLIKNNEVSCKEWKQLWNNKESLVPH